MASRAFFRCRACGEPVGAGAFRCPVCGIDFPAGIPGAPKSDDPVTEATVDAGLGVPKRDTPDSPSDGADPTLKIRPAEARSGREAPQVNLAVRPERREPATPAPPTGKEVVRTRGRSRARALTGTLFSALILLGAVAIGAWWTGVNVGGPASRSVDQSVLTISAGDGWTAIPAAPEGLSVSSDGPFRLRVDGAVYSLAGGRTVRVPADTSAALRVVRGPHTATARALGTR